MFGLSLQVVGLLSIEDGVITIEVDANAYCAQVSCASAPLHAVLLY